MEYMFGVDARFGDLVVEVQGAGHEELNYLLGLPNRFPAWVYEVKGEFGNGFLTYGSYGWGSPERLALVARHGPMSVSDLRARARLVEHISNQVRERDAAQAEALERNRVEFDREMDRLRRERPLTWASIKFGDQGRDTVIREAGKAGYYGAHSPGFSWPDERGWDPY